MKLKILTGLVRLIKANGAVLCGGAVVRRSLMLQDVDLLSMLIRMQRMRTISLMKQNIVRKSSVFVVRNMGTMQKNAPLILILELISEIWSKKCNELLQLIQIVLKQ